MGDRWSLVSDYKIGGAELDQVWRKKVVTRGREIKEIRERGNGGKSGLAYNHWRT